MAKKRRTSKRQSPVQRASDLALISGPKKKRAAGPPKPRKTTHKARSTWFRARVAWPLREAPVRTLLRERSRAFASLAPQPGASQWQSIGPSNVGGRMTSVVHQPNKPEVLWAGAAGGGVWKSDNGGQTWRALWHSQPTLNVGSLAIDPTSPTTLYCGTGEANLSADSYPGVGIFRSLDGGENWQLLAPADTTGIPTRIGAIAIDPFDPGHIRIGGVTHEFTDGSDGMFVSRNAGMSWGRENFPGDSPYRCHAVLFHPTTRDTLFATITARGSRSGIWKSTNGGGLWTQLTNGLPPPDQMGRASLTISSSHPAMVYALVADNDDGVLGVFKSVNGGTSWTNVAGDHFANEGQMSYGNAIAVHPTDPNHVLCGGVDLHLTKDGGSGWRRVTKWDAKRGDKNYAHADHHGLVMPTSQPGLVYDMNDGGMDVSYDGGVNWTNRSNGLATTMFYDVDVAQSDGKVFGGGAQDNGSNVTFVGKADEFKEVSGGDGGWLIIDPKDPGHYYTTAQNMWVYRFRNYTHWTEIPPPATSSERDAVWMAFLDVDPGDSKTVFLGGLRVWRTKNDGATWKAVSPVLDSSPITAVEIAQSDSKRIYIGTENGGIFRSIDGGNSWSGNLSGPVPGRTVTRLFASPKKADLVYATVAGYGGSHVFQSKDGAQTWKDVDQGRLPDVPHHAVSIPTKSPSTLYVCNDAGVFVSTDAGGSWKNLTRNLPTVPIIDLVYQDRDGTLTAASYGRSLWRIKA